MLHHTVEGNALRPLGKNEDLPLVFIRQEAFWYGNEKINSGDQDGSRDCHGGYLVAQRHPKRTVIDGQHPIEDSFEEAP